MVGVWERGVRQGEMPGKEGCHVETHQGLNRTHGSRWLHMMQRRHGVGGGLWIILFKWLIWCHRSVSSIKEEPTLWDISPPAPLGVITRPGPRELSEPQAQSRCGLEFCAHRERERRWWESPKKHEINPPV